MHACAEHRAGVAAANVLRPGARRRDRYDTYGHDSGDDVLAIASRAISESLRDSDFVARTAGDEFVALLPNADLAGALIAAEKIRNAFAKLVVFGSARPITISLGAASYPEHGDAFEALHRSADRALYQAKRDGRNCARGAAPVEREQASAQDGEDGSAKLGLPVIAKPKRTPRAAP